VSRGPLKAGSLSELGLESWSARRGYAVGLAILLPGVAVLGVTGIGRGTFDEAVAGLSQAQPGWLLVAAGAFAVGLLCSAAAWRSGLRSCGSACGYANVSARYAVGSLVNAVAPAHLGGVVRLALLSQTLTGEERVWRAGGVGGAVAAARALSLSALVVVAAGWGRVPLWPAPVIALAVLGLVAACMRLSGRVSGRVRGLLQVFRIFRRSRRTAAAVFAWVALAFVARLGAAVAIAVSLGASKPVFVALVLVTAIALSGLLPLTPGNFGAGAGAVTLALHGTGVGVGMALATGVAFQAVETFSGMTLGLAGVATLASPSSRARRWSLAAAGAGTILVAAVLGVMAVDLV
jgi:uncharacterized membrane protein YbhN (UPF0104 family)